MSKSNRRGLPKRPLLRLIANEADPPSPKGTFGYMVRQHRLMYRYTQKILSEMVNTSVPVIYQIESQGQLPKSREKIIRICECLDIPPIEAFAAVRRQKMRNELRKDCLFLEGKGYRQPRTNKDYVMWRRKKSDLKKHVEADGEGSGEDVRNEESPPERE